MNDKNRKYNKKLVIAITGASGAIYAKLLLNSLEHIISSPNNVAVLFSAEGKKIWAHELGSDHFNDFPFPVFSLDDFNAPFASGSSEYKDMIVCPCSMGTLGRIANGTSDDLICRSADVMLKEKRRLILLVREAPLNSIHLQNMLKLSQAGGIIFPASPSFYSKPQTFDQIVHTIIDRILDMIELPSEIKRWGQEE